ncbi:Xaa-Pro peptidase family protein [Pararhizobium sp. YC-54]|uniref:M24 family metallopeptidase n=1 Tax=Pararhizobium sp. YC-54 TaxID=2986920 RepID=UPI0021F6A273|nr:Xaa-Pro peptidase family protein [Pararhizobium sp. YC-54]MCV9999324.1 Xaa-Pro peptidase family protein [Pararhizobium sp. YC-54]
MPAFSKSEMKRRIDALRAKLAEKQVDVAFLHTADNVFYMTGVPLLSEWGRPMWAILPASGPSAVCGAAIENENMEKHSSFDEVMAYGDDENVVQASLRICAEFIARRGSSKIRLGIEEELLPVGLFRAFQARFPEAELVEIGPLLAELRLIKSHEEIRLLELGADLAKIGADAFLEAMQDNVTELAVAAHAVAAVNKAMGALSINGLTSTYAYAQFGDHTMIPHLHPTSRRLKRGDLVALNIFPVVWGYCAELERTFVYGEPTPELRGPLDAVNEAFDAGKEAMKPGAVMSEIDALTRSILRKYDLDKYIRHGTGHAHGIMIGAASREEHGELRLYNKTKLAANMANSVEPGVYIPSVGGFRHSDVLIITESGARCITDFPRDIGL